MAIQIGSTQSALLECTCQGTMGISFESPNQFYQLINGSTADNDPPPDTIAGNQLKYIKEIAALSIRYAQIIKEKGVITRALTEYSDEGKIIIKSFSKADVSSLSHELGHVFLGDLSATNLDDYFLVRKWTGQTKDKITIEGEEK